MKRLVFLLPLLIILLAFLFVYTKPFVIFPNSKNRISFYSDSTSGQGGHTQLHSCYAGDTAVSVSYTLRKGYSYPYAGISIEPLDGYFPDFYQYDYIDINLTTNVSRSTQFFLNVVEPGITKDTVSISYRYVLYELPARQKSGIQRISLSEFKTPLWWYPLVNVTEKDLGEPHMDKVKKLSFSSGLLLPVNVKDSITIRSIKLGKSYSSFWQWAILISVAYYVFLAAIIYYRKKVNNLPSKVIPYRQLEVEKTEDESLNKCIQYLFTNYANPDLSLTSMAQDLGISSRTISDQIKKQFNLTFKQYINNIRLNEAGRLLKETDLPIKEIAYKVGFNNVTHFNRAFRQHWNCSPQEYRGK